MLRSEHSIVTYEQGHVQPDRLTHGRHRQYLVYAQRMLAVYRSGTARSRRELHQSVRNNLAGEPDRDRRRIAAFCKLLDDRGEVEKDRRGASASLRLGVFSMAAAHHPLLARPRRAGELGDREVKAEIAADLGQPWAQIHDASYADVIDFRRLAHFDGYSTPEALLSRYNVAQLQACLYRAESVSVTVGADFKSVLRYAKLARLLHEIERTGADQYRIALSGPASVLRETRRYGANFARFIPALLACRDWSMLAIVRTHTRARLVLRDSDGLASHLATPVQFDSSIEESFAADFGPKRDGWRLVREGVILHEDQTTFVPDFVFQHIDGREVFLEIVGFWTPQYLQKKRQTLARFGRHRIIIAVAQGLARDGVTQRSECDPLSQAGRPGSRPAST